MNRSVVVDPRMAPAVVYAAFNWGDATALRGWAIPTATDIAFAVGVLTLLDQITIWTLAGLTLVMGSMMAVLLTSTWYYSIPRMLLTMFPIVLFLSETTGRRPALHDWMVIALAPLAALGVVVFTQGNWFY